MVHFLLMCIFKFKLCPELKYFCHSISYDLEKNTMT